MACDRNRACGLALVVTLTAQNGGPTSLNTSNEYIIYALSRKIVLKLSLERVARQIALNPGKPAPAQIHPAHGGHMSAVLPSILSAVAATIAAAFAGLTLYVSGRREHLQWIRESLVNSYEKVTG